MTLDHKAKPLLPHPTLDTLHTLKRMGMYPALLEQRPMPEMTAVPSAARLGRRVERESPAREDRRLQSRVQQAQLRHTACLEARAYRPPRGLDTSLVRSVATWQWVRDRHTVRITGPTGIGTTWRAGALGPQACRTGWTLRSLRLPRLLQECPLAKGDGRYGKRRTALATPDVLRLDDGGLAPRSDDNRRAFLALLAARLACRATIVTSQLPGEHWHEASGEPTLADALLDRLVHNASTLAWKGDARRKRQATMPTQAPSV